MFFFEEFSNCSVKNEIKFKKQGAEDSESLENPNKYLGKGRTLHPHLESLTSPSVSFPSTAVG